MIRASKPAILAMIIILALISFLVPFRPLSILAVILLALIAIWIILEKQKPGITNRIMKNLGETKILIQDGNLTLTAPTADVTVTATARSPFAVIDGTEVAISDGIGIERDSKEVKKIELYVPECLKSVSLALVSGDLDVRDVKCDELHAKSVSGNVKLTHITCDSLEAKSVSGDAEIWEHSGKTLDAASISGDVDAESDAASISVSTTSGSILVRYRGKSKPSVTASSVSGSWEVFSRSGIGQFTETGTEGSITAKSISGEIRIKG